MSKAVEELRGRVNGMGNIEVEVDVANINWRKPISISSKGNASFKFNEKYLVEVVDQDGITVPLTLSVGVYMDRKSWRNYMDQVAGRKEGQKAGTNTASTNVVKYTLEQLEVLKDKGLLKEEMVQSLLEKGLVEL